MIFHKPLKNIPAALFLSLVSLSGAQAADLRVVVGFHGKSDPGIFARVGGTAAVQLDRLGAVAGHVPTAKIHALRRMPGVAYVEEDLVRHASAVPNDTYYDYTFSRRYERDGYNDQRDDFALINAQTAWDSTNGLNLRVAVLDTGIDLDHPDLPQALAAKDFTGSGSMQDHNGHGTHVSGTVAAKTNNSRGVAGTAGGASLLVGKVLGPNGGYDSWVANGMLWAASQGAHVINMSLGGEGYSSTLASAAQSVWDDGVLSVAAAGNSGGDGSNHYPSADKNVMAVAAVDEVGRWASFSNYGKTLEVAAPGVNILSTYDGGSYGWLSGTSMASPHVAGVAALVLAVHPTMTNAELRSQLASGSGAVTAPDGGSVPILDAAAALTVSSGTPSVLILTPSAGSTVSGTVTVSASANSPSGSVAQVEFFFNNTSLGVDANSGDGWAVSWDSSEISDGSHTLSAVVTDSSNQTASDTIAVTVDNIDSPPQVSITSPSAGSIVSGSVMLAAEAADDQGVSKVEFYLDGVNVGYDLSAPFAVSWDSTGAADGSHSVVARAVDTSGQTTNSSSVGFTVENTASPTPTLTVESIAPDTVASGSSANVTIKGSGFSSAASVSALNGSGSQPEFYNVQVVDSNTITGTVSAKSGGPPRNRTWDVQVASGSSTATLKGGLTVTR